MTITMHIVINQYGHFHFTDKINKNANAVMDRGCQEIGEEIEVFELSLLKYALYLYFSACAGLYDKDKLKPRD